MVGTQTIMDGKALSEKIKLDLTERVKELVMQGVQPTLEIYTNSDEASKVYVRNKAKFGETIGVQVIQKDLYAELYYWNANHQDGIDKYKYEQWFPFIVQLPLDPRVKSLLNIHTDSEIFNYFFGIGGNIADLDMDGFNPTNIGKLFLGEPCVQPCTPAGIMRLFEEYNVTLPENEAVIFGRSNIVGKPLAIMMMQAGATVTNVHTGTDFYTRKSLLKRSGVIVSAMGRRGVYDNFLPDEIPPVVVDVGMNRDENGKLCGDIPKEKLTEAWAYTPVPGGVGPMTVAMLFENVVRYYECNDIAYKKDETTGKIVEARKG